MYGKELVVCVKYTSGNSSSNCEPNVSWKVEHQITEEAELRGHGQWRKLQQQGIAWGGAYPEKHIAGSREFWL